MKAREWENSPPDPADETLGCFVLKREMLERGTGMDSAQISAIRAAAPTRVATGGAAGRPNARHGPREVPRDSSVSESWRQAADLAAEIIGARTTPDAITGRVTFDVDPVTQKIIVRLVDPETNEVLREIPPEEMRRVLNSGADLRGLRVDRSA